MVLPSSEGISSRDRLFQAQLVMRSIALWHVSKETFGAFVNVYGGKGYKS